MPAPSSPTIAAAFVQAGGPIAAELAGAVAELEEHQVAQAATLLLGAERVFMLGAGRSLLAIRMGAMRLMHLGLSVFVVGDVTTPAIRRGDLLVVASGSGTTPGIVAAATKARAAGASVLAITTDPKSPLAAQADAILHIPAAGKLDRSGEASIQYAGSLFEQAVLLTFDTLFHALWITGSQSAADLWARHANLE